MERKKCSRLYTNLVLRSIGWYSSVSRCEATKQKQKKKKLKTGRPNQSDSWNERVKSLMRSLISAYNEIMGWNDAYKNTHTYTPDSMQSIKQLNKKHYPFCDVSGQVLERRWPQSWKLKMRDFFFLYWWYWCVQRNENSRLKVYY